MKLFGQERDLRVSMSDLQEELNNMLSRLWHGGLVTKPLDGQDWAPRIDLLDEPGRYVIRAEVPGVGLADVEVSVLGRTVTIKGHKPPPDLEATSGRLVFGEAKYGSFHRQLDLPEEVNADDVAATEAHGVLTLILPKADTSQDQPVRIEIRQG